jgi:thioredoxin-dependent peroxiredoxin
MPEFEKRDTAVLGVSIDPVDTHYRWLNRIEQSSGTPVTFPIAEDPNRWIASLYGMTDPSSVGGRTVRSVFVIDPGDRVRMTLAYPACTRRSFAELLRVIDALQRSDAGAVATPDGLHPGEDLAPRSP